MIVGAAFCPHPPALVSELAQGAAGELARVRAAAFHAARTIGAGGLPVLVLGAGPRDEGFAPGATGSMAGFGVDVRVTLGVAPGSGPPEFGDAAAQPPVTCPLPLSLTLGAWLLREALGEHVPARGWAVAPNAAAAGASAGNATDRQELVRDLLQHASRDCVLLVMGDGSARRSPTAPGYFDDRAAGFDAGVAAALASGEPAALAALDPVLGAELLAGGVPAWHAAAAVLGPSVPTDASYADAGYDGTVLLDDAPRGVGYFVATWRRRDRGTP